MDPAVRTDLRCPDCGSLLAYLATVPGRRPFYGCTQHGKTGCRGGIGAHPDGSPVGTPADQATRDARVRAHDAFDSLWRVGGFTRKEAYAWLQGAMGMLPDQAHIGRFDLEQCGAVVAHVEKRFGHKLGEPADPRLEQLFRRR